MSNHSDAWSGFGKGRDRADFKPIPSRDCERDGHEMVSIGNEREECRHPHPPIPPNRPSN